MRAHIIGGGFGGLAAAALLIRNAGVSGENITIYEADEQVGRNDPCWCGSGKKFKKCHGA